jgi:hypothetical protein
MARIIVAHFTQKASALGFVIDNPKDVDLLPNEFFLPGFPDGPAAAALLAAYHRARARPHRGNAGVTQ